MRKLICRLIVVLAVGWAGAANAGLLTVTDGKLSGIDGLVINDTLYDVRFVDGDFNSVYSDGWPTIVDAPYFIDGDYALLATQTIFREIMGTIFASTPSDIVGCTEAELCEIATPHSYVSDGKYVTTVNAVIMRDFDGGISSTYARNRLSNTPSFTYAVYQISSQVPAPATLALFGIGFAGLGWSERRKAIRRQYA